MLRVRAFRQGAVPRGDHLTESVEHLSHPDGALDVGAVFRSADRRGEVEVSLVKGPADSERHLGKLPGPNSDLTFKYYFDDPNTLPEYAAVLSQPSLGLEMRVQADPHVASWFGIWWNAGGRFGHNNVAIEPASAPMDSLSAARRLDRLPLLAPHAYVFWWMVVSVKLYQTTVGSPLRRRMGTRCREAQ